MSRLTPNISRQVPSGAWRALTVISVDTVDPSARVRRTRGMCTRGAFPAGTGAAEAFAELAQHGVAFVGIQDAAEAPRVHGVT